MELVLGYDKESMKLVNRLGIIVGSVIVLFMLTMLQPWVFLPHRHLEVTLPFSNSDDDASLIPMGEKLFHNESNGNPNGHPGIDFGWNRKVTIIASADGRINSIHHNVEGYDISESSGLYHINYKELAVLDSKIHRFVKVKQGQIIGYTGTNANTPPDSRNHQQIHWELTSASKIIDRLCPVGYLSDDSLRRINVIWNRVPKDDQFKSKYSDICSGIFNNRED